MGRFHGRVGREGLGMSLVGLRWCDIVRRCFPRASMAECEFLLWERTIYPMGDPDEVYADLLRQRGTRESKLARRWHRREARRLLRQMAR